MKPSNIPGEVAILDTYPECRVVLDAIESPAYAQAYGDEEQSFKQFENSIGVRFRQQAEYEPNLGVTGNVGAVYVEPILKDVPEFHVRDDDVEFVVNAARKVLHERDVFARIINRLTKRTQAARLIMRHLSDL